MIERLRTLGTVPLLAAACAVQLAIVAAIALTSTHNHFVWYSGGDSTEYWTTSWSLGHGLIPQALVGYGVPVAYAWLPPLSGTTLLSGLPVIVVLQGIGLVVLATLLVFGIGDLLFGRRYAWVALALWILGPLLMLWGFSANYAPQFRDLFLAPHWYGLTNMADMPSLVAILATTWAGLRAYESKRIEDGVLAGLFLGLAIGIKPSNGFFVPALAVLLLASRSWRVIVATGVACVPALVTLALWKDKGRGFLPITSSTAPVHEACGDGADARRRRLVRALRLGAPRDDAARPVRGLLEPAPARVPALRRAARRAPAFVGEGRVPRALVRGVRARRRGAAT